jgi:Cu/Ag efflux protein CusF
MYVSRYLLAAMLFCLAAYAPKVNAQTEQGVKTTNQSLEAGKPWRFTGRIEDVNPGSRTVTIAADSLPSTGEPAPGTLPYTVPKSVSIEKFHKGDRVTGEMTLKNHLMKVTHVQLASSPGQKAPRKENGGKATKNPG